MCVAFGSGQNLTVNAEKHGQWLGPVSVDLRAVVGDETVRKRLHVFRRGIVFNDEFDGVGVTLGSWCRHGECSDVAPGWAAWAVRRLSSRRGVRRRIR